MTVAVAFLQPDWADWEAGAVLALLRREFGVQIEIATPDGEAGLAALGGRDDVRVLLLRGAGDNVVSRSANLVGIARYVRTSDKVLEYLTNGVPADTIAIVDDSGGTLTAPILEKFKGVLCAGGTTRSHLAILTRETVLYFLPLAALWLARPLWIGRPSAVSRSHSWVWMSNTAADRDRCSPCSSANARHWGARIIVPSSCTSSPMTPTGERPASLVRSTAASVWPRRTRTPPSR